MAGIYLHIPFCKRRCIYCDFYSTTQNEKKSSYINALCRELEERKTIWKVKNRNNLSGWRNSIATGI